MTPPNQLFNFDTLAESAISLFGVSKQDVKYSAVSLFEKGFISYPLTDQTKAFSSDKDTLHTILNQCCNADSIEFSLYSKEALSIFEGNEKTLLQNSTGKQFDLKQECLKRSMPIPKSKEIDSVEVK